MGASITGWGSALPERIVTNEELALDLGVSPGWIFERTGINTRRIACGAESTSSLATEASAVALARAGIGARDVDMIIVATSTPDYQLPATASLVQHDLGCSNAGGYDLAAACTGFLYGLAQAHALVEGGACDVVLVAGSETLSKVTDYSDPRSCVLFGDGAGAVIVQKTETPAIGPFMFRSDGRFADMLYIRPDERLIRMQGREVYRHAVEAMSGALAELLVSSGLRVSDLDLVVAHQANGRILDAVADRMGLDRSRMAMHIAEVGNTSAASIPLALDDAFENGRLREGDLVALTAFGAGFTWGAGLVRWGSSRTAPDHPARVPALVGTVGHLLEVL